MTEQIKKAPRPPDPNSGKYKLDYIANKVIKDAFEAKARGEKVGWCSSAFPKEIIETLGIPVVYPESHAVVVAARGGGQRMCEVAEAEGYSNDICAYARIAIAYATKVKDTPEQNIPLPDFLLCCSNICNTMINWYENLAKELNIPLIMLDIPINPDNEISDAQFAYVKGQLLAAIKQLEELTGKKWSDERFKEVLKMNKRVCQAFLEVTSLGKHVPSPYSGFELFNLMGPMMFARQKAETLDAIETCLKEYKENLAKGVSTFKAEEKYRIISEGIACWPWLRVTYNGLKNRGINMVTTIYAVAPGFLLYDDFDGMIRASCRVPMAINLQTSRDDRVKLIKDSNVDGMLVHVNRSCKVWSGFLYEMCRQVAEECNIPVAYFDGDQADPRVFSEAQYETRVQGLAEIMESRKGDVKA